LSLPVPKMLAKKTMVPTDLALNYTQWQSRLRAAITTSTVAAVTKVSSTQSIINNKIRK
jgi:hypothetical protein